jgi:hypothetical protein
MHPVDKVAQRYRISSFSSARGFSSVLDFYVPTLKRGICGV